MENLPPEVWLIILSYLPLNDLVQASAVCKLFFGLSRKISLFNEKLLHLRLLFNNSRFVFDWYENACLSFYTQLCFCLKKYVKCEDHFIKAREIIISKLMLSILPFRVWNHTFLCERSQYCTDMCNFCTKPYVSNKKISDHINKTFFVPIEGFHSSIREGIVLVEKFYIFAHTNIFIDKDDPYRRYANFGSLYYESVNSPFLLWKMYLDTICRIAFNVFGKFLLPIFISSVGDNCRTATACTKQNCSGLKRKVIKTFLYKRLVEFCLSISIDSCKNVNHSFIHDVYRTCKKNRDFFIRFLDIDRNE